MCDSHKSLICTYRIDSAKNMWSWITVGLLAGKWIGSQSWPIMIGLKSPDGPVNKFVQFLKAMVKCKRKEMYKWNKLSYIIIVYAYKYNINVHFSVYLMNNFVVNYFTEWNLSLHRCSYHVNYTLCLSRWVVGAAVPPPAFLHSSLNWWLVSSDLLLLVAGTTVDGANS